MSMDIVYTNVSLYSSGVEAVVPTSYVQIRFEPQFRTSEATYIIALIQLMIPICNWHVSSGNKVLLSHQHQKTAPHSLNCHGDDVFDVLPPRRYDELKRLAARDARMGSSYPRARFKTSRLQVDRMRDHETNEHNAMINGEI